MDAIEEIAKIAAEAKNTYPAEQISLETQIMAYLPEGKREDAVENLHFLLQVAYLRGQRDALLETIEKQSRAIKHKSMKPFTQPTSEHPA
ncbi:MAG: hypothetical protein WC455_26520 [Dehalococcoidia bacterium]|jgi:hypothetical protein